MSTVWRLWPHLRATRPINYYCCYATDKCRLNLQGLYTPPLAHLKLTCINEEQNTFSNERVCFEKEINDVLMSKRCTTVSVFTLEEIPVRINTVVTVKTHDKNLLLNHKPDLTPFNQSWEVISHFLNDDSRWERALICISNLASALKLTAQHLVEDIWGVSYWESEHYHHFI